ncbi:Hypothetical protein, putative [Bodo saltans]|uniref:Uncharacterized protein n=1 Tax=Bodo saltans TaxID=75058 RepID=A0A0S4J1W5_BODSA|nr:Hypothetical protein, putative [Bodo saltans]|eukprot:CUG55131.1 Hypothetical protein, putative [Bodo saltans]
MSPHLSPGDFHHMMSPSISVSPTTVLQPTSNTIVMGNSPYSDVATKPKFQARPIRTALVSVSSFVSIAKTSPSTSHPQQQAGQQPQPPRQSPPVVLNCRSFKQFTRFGSDGSLPTSPRGGQGLPPVSPTANPSPRSFASLPPTVSPHPLGTCSAKDNAEQHPLPPSSARVASSPSLLRPASSPQNAPRQQNVGASSNARGGSSSTVISPRALTSASSARVLSAGGTTKNRTTLTKKSK